MTTIPFYPISMDAEPLKIPKAGIDGKIAIGYIPDLSGVYQPLGDDLTAIEALSSTGFAKRTGVNTWSVGALVAGDIPDLSGIYPLLNHIHDDRYYTESEIDGFIAGRQPFGSDLTAIEALSGIGFAKRTASDTWSVGALVSGDIPDLSAIYALVSHNHAASAITSGLLALARGGTNADLSATGSATHFLRQASAGAAITVGAIVSADLTSALTTPPAIGGTTSAAGAFTSLSASITDAVLNAVTDVLNVTHLSSGTPTTAFGVGVGLRGHSATPANGIRDLARIRASWTDATDAARTSKIILSIVNAAAATDMVTIEPAKVTLAGALYASSFVFTSGSLPSGISNYINNYNSNTGVVFRKLSTGGGDHFAIETSTPTTLFIVKSSGRVGVGTSAPDSLLDVRDLVIAKVNDAVTNAISPALKLGHNTSGHAAANYGSQILMELESSSTPDVSVGSIDWLWNVATHSGRLPDVVLKLVDYAGTREIMRGRANGSAPLVGFLGAAPVAQAAHIADPSGGVTIDAEARTAINAILVVLENLGFNATS